MSEAKGVKETLEVLEGFKVVAVPVKAALKDGFQPSDLAQALEIIKKYQVVLDAIDGAADVVGEAKDLDPVEASVVAAKVFEVIKAIKAA
jgi:uncharacterized membrane-anchored protein